MASVKVMIRFLSFCVLAFFIGCQSEVPNDNKQTDATPGNAADDVPEIESEFVKTELLFDGQVLDQWEVTEFGGEGDVSVEDGCIVMDAGDPFTAINLPESYPLPTTNYELEFEAMKVRGTDFFGTVTFPVGDSFCSMVVGGWAGTVVGLSSIDGLDASENETRSVRKFQRERWYKVRVRVTPESIQGWIDDDQVFAQVIEGKEVSIRGEMIPCRPLGIANFYTTAKIKNIELRHLAVDEEKTQR